MSLAALWQSDNNLPTDDKAWKRQLKRNVRRHCPKGNECNFLLSKSRLNVISSFPKHDLIHLFPHPTFMISVLPNMKFSCSISFIPKLEWRVKLTASTPDSLLKMPASMSVFMYMYTHTYTHIHKTLTWHGKVWNLNPDSKNTRLPNCYLWQSEAGTQAWSKIC